MVSATAAHHCGMPETKLKVPSRPSTAQVRAPLARPLLPDDPVVRALGAQERHDRALGRPVGRGHEVDGAALGGHVEAIAADGERGRRAGARRAAGELGVGAHRRWPRTKSA